jgi:hypothetical protein
LLPTRSRRDRSQSARHAFASVAPGDHWREADCKDSRH